MKNLFLSSFLYALLSVFIFPPTPLSAADPGEIAALAALYDATDGDNWINKANWKNGMDPCDELALWFGVECDGSGHIAAIELVNNNLNGSLPAALGDLLHLTILNLSNNQLSGGIPTELGVLSSLNNLSLSYNQLSGSIPIALGNLSNLESLSLEFNQLNGSIPEELGNLISLQYLNLSTNQLSGGIPSALGNLGNLISLDLATNQLSGPIPPEFGNLINLTHLFIPNNQLSDSIPAALANLINLEQFYFPNNLLSGCIPEELQIFCGIDYDLSNNPGLPWQGDFSRFCNGEDQIGAVCDDANPATINDLITADCGCMGMVNECRMSDSLVLVALYNASGGSNWTNAWDLNQPMDNWYGVELNEEGCVRCLDLDGNPDCSGGDETGNNLVGVILLYW